MPDIIPILYFLIVLLTALIVILWFRLYAVRNYVRRLKKVILKLEGRNVVDPKEESPAITMND